MKTQTKKLHKILCSTLPWIETKLVKCNKKKTYFSFLLPLPLLPRSEIWKYVRWYKIITSNHGITCYRQACLQSNCFREIWSVLNYYLLSPFFQTFWLNDLIFKVLMNHRLLHFPHFLRNILSLLTQFYFVCLQALDHQILHAELRHFTSLPSNWNNFVI